MVNGINLITPYPVRGTLGSRSRAYESKERLVEIKPQEKIGVGEGLGLLVKGVGKQVGSMITSIVQNPLKTAAVIGATTAGIMALPIIGIPAAVGGSALALGFGGLAIAKGAKHTVEFLHNNSNGNYDKARKNLEQLGGDTVDVAMLAPFMPKALKRVKEFTKFGKIAYNSAVLNELKAAKGIKAKFGVLKNANSEAVRKFNFSKTVDVEIAKIKGITQEQAAAIKKDLLEFNVPENKIPEVVLEKYAQIKGINAKPNLKFGPMSSKDTAGYACANDCSITLANGQVKPQTSGTKTSAPRYTQIENKKLIGDEYEFTYKDNRTGLKIKQRVKKSIVDERNALIDSYDKLSSQGNKILTTVHEREHIDQYRRILTYDPKAYRLSSDAKKLYSQMIKEKGALSAAERAEVIEMLKAPNYHDKPFAAYIKDPFEIGARKIESKALNNPIFKKLDEVFKQVNTMKDTTNYKQLLALNAARAQSASV